MSNIKKREGGGQDNVIEEINLREREEGGQGEQERALKSGSGSRRGPQRE